MDSWITLAALIGAIDVLVTDQCPPVVVLSGALAALLFANIVVIGTSRGWFDTLNISLILIGASVTAYIMISRALTEKALANAGDNEPGEFL